MSVSTQTYELGDAGTITITIDVDIFKLGRTGRVALYSFIDGLDGLDGMAASSTTAPETTPLSSSGTDRVATPTRRRKEGKGSPAATRSECPYGCGKSYRRSSMYKHRDICPNRPDAPPAQLFVCGRGCGKTFAKQNGLTIHEKTCKATPVAVESEEAQAAPSPISAIINGLHAGVEQMLRCSQCGETFAVDELDEFDRHVRDAHDRSAKPFERRPRSVVS
jgi:hypothetical protein